MGWATINPYEYAWISFVWFSFCFHILVIYIIISYRSTGKQRIFNGPFFTLYLIQAFHEIAMFVTVNFINRPRMFKLVHYDYDEPSMTLFIEGYQFRILKEQICFGHVLVALNRLTAFIARTPNFYDRIWSTRTVVILVISGYVTSVLLHLPHMLSGNQFMLKNIGDNPIPIIAYTNPTFGKEDTSIEISFTGICAILCIIMYAIAGYRCTKTMSSHRKKQEMVVLRCAFFTFIVFIPSVVRVSLIKFGTMFDATYVVYITSRIACSVTDVLCIFPPWAILVSCPPVRKRLGQIFCHRSSIGVYATEGNDKSNSAGTDGKNSKTEENEQAV